MTNVFSDNLVDPGRNCRGSGAKRVLPSAACTQRRLGEPTCVATTTRPCNAVGRNISLSEIKATLSLLLNITFFNILSLSVRHNEYVLSLYCIEFYFAVWPKHCRPLSTSSEADILSISLVISDLIHIIMHIDPDVIYCTFQSKRWCQGGSNMAYLHVGPRVGASDVVRVTATAFCHHHYWNSLDMLLKFCFGKVCSDCSEQRLSDIFCICSLCRCNWMPW